MLKCLTLNIFIQMNKLIIIVFISLFIDTFSFGQPKVNFKELDTSISSLNLNYLTKVDSIIKVKKHKNIKSSIKNYWLNYSTIDLLVNNQFYLTLFEGTKTIDSSHYSYVEICKFKKGSKKRYYATALNWDSLPKTNNNIYLGMSTSEFSNSKKDVVFDNIRPYKDFWVLEFSISNDSITDNFTYSTAIISRNLKFYNSDVFQNSENELASFNEKIKSNKHKKYIARYIFKNHKLVKYGFGYLNDHPTDDFEGLLY
jgi:hypothetical protein